MGIFFPGARRQSKSDEARARAVRYLSADGAAVEERAEREGEPSEVKVEPLGPAADRRRLVCPGRDGEVRPEGLEGPGAEVMGRVPGRAAEGRAARPRGGGDGGCCH
jgi:hypothetical protein